MKGSPNPGNPELAQRLQGLTQQEVAAFVEANLFVDFVDSLRSQYEAGYLPTKYDISHNLDLGKRVPSMRRRRNVQK